MKLEDVAKADSLVRRRRSLLHLLKQANARSIVQSRVGYEDGIDDIGPWFENLNYSLDCMAKRELEHVERALTELGVELPKEVHLLP